jgi:hypothetical protein
LTRRFGTLLACDEEPSVAEAARQSPCLDNEQGS